MITFRLAFFGLSGGAMSRGFAGCAAAFGAFGRGATGFCASGRSHRGLMRARAMSFLAFGFGSLIAVTGVCCSGT